MRFNVGFRFVVLYRSATRNVVNEENLHSRHLTFEWNALVNGKTSFLNHKSWKLSKWVWKIKLRKILLLLMTFPCSFLFFGPSMTSIGSFRSKFSSSYWNVVWVNMIKVSFHFMIHILSRVEVKRLIISLTLIILWWCQDVIVLVVTRYSLSFRMQSRRMKHESYDMEVYYCWLMLNLNQWKYFPVTYCLKSRREALQDTFDGIIFHKVQWTQIKVYVKS